MTDVYRGRLGWSNKRSGVEFYREMPDGSNGRWGVSHGREKAEQFGALLVDEIDPRMNREGQPVIVVVLSRAASAADVEDAVARVTEALK